MHLNKESVLTAASRNFQSLRSKIGKVIDDAVSLAREESLDETEQHTIIKSKYIWVLVFFIWNCCYCLSVFVLSFANIIVLVCLDLFLCYYDLYYRIY